MKTCICCGMPMEKAADFAMGDESKDYCVYCARPDGSMKTYEEALEGMTGFIIQTQGLDAEQARAAAKAALAELPAWKKVSCPAGTETPQPQRSRKIAMQFRGFALLLFKAV